MTLSASPFCLFILINSNASGRLSQTLMDNKGISKIPPQSENPSKNQTLVALLPDNFQENVEKRSLKLSTIRSNSHHHGRRFLGVRQRPSGRWVAEIKDSSLKLRLWLGTFDNPEDAAMAYDNAARILRGRNAKTNFRHPHGIRNFYEQNFSLLGQNPRIFQVLQNLITKSSPLNQKMDNNRDEFIKFDTLVEETIFCSSSSSSSSWSSSSDCSHGYGFSFGNSKVYSSVVVAPSFSSQGREDRNTN